MAEKRATRLKKVEDMIDELEDELRAAKIAVRHKHPGITEDDVAKGMYSFVHMHPMLLSRFVSHNHL
jgi:hypothetical protein